jgi:ADP-ribose pyrophosphatase
VPFTVSLLTVSLFVTVLENMKVDSRDWSDGEYPNQPCVAVGAVVFHNNGVLLVRRGQPPSQDLWAIPGGKVGLGETLQEAAEREILEETGVTIHARRPIYTFDLLEKDEHGRIQFHYVIIDLIADYVAGQIHAGDDAREVRWVRPDDLHQLSISPRTISLLQNEFGFGLPAAPEG